MNSTQMASNVASVANTSTSSVQPVMVQSQPAQNTSTSSGNVLIKEANSFSFGEHFIGLEKKRHEPKGSFFPFKKVPSNRKLYICVDEGKVKFAFQDHATHGVPSSINFHCDEKFINEKEKKYTGKEQFTKFFYQADDFFRQMVIDNASVLFPEIEEISEVQELIKAIYNPICKKGKALDAAQKAKQKEVNAQKKEQDRKTFNTWPRSISLPVNKNRSGDVIMVVKDANNRPCSAYDIGSNEKVKVWEEFLGLYVKTPTKDQPQPSVSVRHNCAMIQLMDDGPRESDALELASVSGVVDTENIQTIQRKRKIESQEDSITENNNENDSAENPQEESVPYQVSTVSKRSKV